MSTINFAKKELHCKIVYYGPGLSGKTTNLEYIHEHVKKENRSDMVSLNTQGDRTLFFDFLPLQSYVFQGFKTRFHLYTVPGQVMYNATRKLVLQGVDGIVFVADSQKSKTEENRESFANLKENLSDYNINLTDIPYILIYNKRDLPNIVSVSILDFLLNRGKVKVPSLETVAIKGIGVFKALNLISRMVLVKLRDEIENKRPKGPQ